MRITDNSIKKIEVALLCEEYHNLIQMIREKYPQLDNHSQCPDGPLSCKIQDDTGQVQLVFTTLWSPKANQPLSQSSQRYYLTGRGYDVTIVFLFLKDDGAQGSIGKRYQVFAPLLKDQPEKKDCKIVVIGVSKFACSIDWTPKNKALLQQYAKSCGAFLTIERDCSDLGECNLFKLITDTYFKRDEDYYNNKKREEAKAEHKKNLISEIEMYIGDLKKMAKSQNLKTEALIDSNLKRTRPYGFLSAHCYKRMMVANALIAHIQDGEALPKYALLKNDRVLSGVLAKYRQIMLEDTASAPASESRCMIQ